jgi:cytochrome c-type biogenesis protein CcmF
VLFGNLCLIISLILVLLSAFFFLQGVKGDGKLLKIGRKTYYASFFFIFLACTTLMYLFFAHRFQVEYVHDYSSSAEPFFYLVSGFWAGQEGSFLLWLFFASLLGIFLIASRKKYSFFHEESGIREGHVMFFYLLVQVFLLVLLLKKSPFSLLPDVPADGRGLNPLLKDFWMVIHPPIVFLGYAALAFPFAYALSALTTNKYESWAKLTLPWVGFSCLSLGAGIFIGAYWAYKVLGWGGYWGWDPVENASLVPWLVSVALIHGLLLERVKKVLVRTNLLLAIFSFLLVVYATFLVRSGVLGDFSVHSFADLGITAYLLVFMIFFFFLSFGLYFSRLRSIPHTKSSESVLTIEFALFIGIILFALSSLMILLGTSSPIISRIFGPPSSVSIPYYIWTQLPLAVLVFLVLGIVPFLHWKASSMSEFSKTFQPALIVTLILTIFAFIIGVRTPAYLICMFAAFLALTGNLMVLIRRRKGGLKLVGGFLTHLGTGILLVGIITSSGYDKSEKLILPKGETGEAFGYHFTYRGIDSSSTVKNELLRIEVQKGNTKFTAQPKFYFSQYNQGIMRNPHIRITPFYDLYLSPLEHTQGEDDQKNLFQIRKGETKEKGDYRIGFVEFDMKSHGQKGQISVGAVLEIERGQEKIILTPSMVMGGIEENQIKQMVHLPGGGDHLLLEKIDADRKMVTLRLVSEGEKTSQDLLVLNVGKKPLINLFWLGTLLVMLGLTVATVRRIGEVKKG